MKATEVYPSGAEGADRVSKRASLRPFTEAVKGGMSGSQAETGRVNQLGFHAQLITRTGSFGDPTVHELKSLKDLHQHSAVLNDPDTRASLHVGIGQPNVIADARKTSAAGLTPYRGPFHTHVHLEKGPGSTTFIPAFMYTNPNHQQKGWGITLWNHLHRKLTKVGLGLDHDWKHQTAAGHVWSRKTSGREGDAGPLSQYELEHRLSGSSEWHHLNPEQKSSFLTRATQLIGRGKGEFNDPKLRHSKGLVGDTEVRVVRDHMKKVHGVNMHPYSVADTLHHMTGREGPYSYQSGYHGASLPRLSTRFDLAQSKRANAGKGEPNELVRTPLKGDKKPGIAARRRAKAAMNAAPKEPLKHATYYF